MAYSLKPSDRTLMAGIRRVAAAQSEAALAAAADHDLTLDQKVHALRRRSKKLRALIRLVRPGFDAYRHENAALRDAARRLAPARDAAVMKETFERLSAVYMDRLPPALCAGITERLAGRRAALTDKQVGAAVTASARDFAALSARIDDWRLEAGEREVVEAGFGKSLRKVEHTMAKASDTGIAEDFHNWRKWAKYHSMHVRLMKRVWPEKLDDRARDLRRLVEMLGTHHDVYVLCEILREDPEGAAAAAEFEDTVAAPELKRLEGAALALGEDLLPDDPHLLSTRLVAYWDLAVDDRFRPSA